MGILYCFLLFYCGQSPCLHHLGKDMNIDLLFLTTKQSDLLYVLCKESASILSSV